MKLAIVIVHELMCKMLKERHTGIFGWDKFGYWKGQKECRDASCRTWKLMQQKPHVPFTALMTPLTDTTDSERERERGINPL